MNSEMTETSLARVTGELYTEAEATFEATSLVAPTLLVGFYQTLYAVLVRLTFVG
jgi:hypothetical protein